MFIILLYTTFVSLPFSQHGVNWSELVLTPLCHSRCKDDKCSCRWPFDLQGCVSGFIHILRFPLISILHTRAWHIFVLMSEYLKSFEARVLCQINHSNSVLIISNVIHQLIWKYKLWFTLSKYLFTWSGAGRYYTLWTLFMALASLIYIHKHGCNDNRII